MRNPVVFHNKHSNTLHSIFIINIWRKNYIDMDHAISKPVIGSVISGNNSSINTLFQVQPQVHTFFHFTNKVVTQVNKCKIRGSRKKSLQGVCLKIQHGRNVMASLFYNSTIGNSINFMFLAIRSFFEY